MAVVPELRRVRRERGGGAGRRPAAGTARIDLDRLLSEANYGAKLVYLPNPNNPTGVLLDRADVRRLIDEVPPDVLVVLDEAYAEYADPEPEGPALLRDGRERLCVLRTFSKVYGLASLRVGYALASPAIADGLDRVRPIFNVNQPAQEAALASLHEQHAIGGRVAHARRAREQIRAALESAGLDPEPSQTNFVYADVPGRRRRRPGRPPPARGLHRARADRLRRARRDPRDRRHGRGERAVRGGAARRASDSRSDARARSTRPRSSPPCRGRTPS